MLPANQPCCGLWIHIADIIFRRERFPGSSFNFRHGIIPRANIDSLFFEIYRAIMLFDEGNDALDIVLKMSCWVISARTVTTQQANKIQYRQFVRWQQMIGRLSHR